jgi:hypothetical protein
MTTGMSDEQIYEIARQRVKARKDFYGHLASWVIVNVILIIVWALTIPGGYPWFLWPLCIWGIFVFVHFLRAFVFKPKSEISAIEKEAEKIRKEQG